jgi:SAM-dependent methyltransferase
MKHVLFVLVGQIGCPAMNRLVRRARPTVARLAGAKGRALYHRVRSNPALPPQLIYVNRPSDGKPRVLWPQFPPPGYLGQLSDVFQAQMARERDYLELDDCYFYHSSTLRDGSFINGPWDLRGHESEYLGNVSLRGMRVLELGPATGHLTYYMENEGASVVCLDAGFDVSIDLLPYECQDLSARRMEQAKVVGSVQNSWWYLHRDCQSKVKMVYGNIYRLPGDIGTFDIATFQAILLHLRDPFTALEQAARRTTRAIVVTEPVDPELERCGSDGIRFHPTRQKGTTTGWWSFSPGGVEVMLDSLGFHNIRTSMHSQLHHIDHKMEQPPVQLRMFTVVAEK